MPATIAVYAHWIGLAEPLRLGLLHARRGAGREVFEFEFDAAALAHPATRNLHLDPRLGLFEGRQHPPQGHENFGVFADASPDRWGRLLMRRRLERAQRAGQVAQAVRLHESDYLLGVHDAYRSGALRLRLNDEGDSLDNQGGTAAPPFVQLRELEAASLALERDEDNTSAAGDDWLRMLIAPGGSLGGARPKASVADPQGQLWIAKFPSVRDEHDVGAWELVVQTLARGCGLAVPESLARKFASPHHTFLVRRFDRTPQGRLHFASAMTLAGRLDGDDASAGASYLEIARVLIEHGAQSHVAPVLAADLEQGVGDLAQRADPHRVHQHLEHVAVVHHGLLQALQHGRRRRPRCAAGSRAAASAGPASRPRWSAPVPASPSRCRRAGCGRC
jgi:serine/threonine-protein kinase HipA